MAKMKRYNEDYQITRGELTDQQKVRFETATKSYDRILSATQSLSDYLSYKFPELPLEEKTEDFAATFVDSNTRTGEERDWITTPWEDEETMKFYTNIPDLLSSVPPGHLKFDEKKKKQKKKDKRNGDDDEWDEYLEEVDGE